MRGILCRSCGRRYHDYDDYRDHLPECRVRARFRELHFKEIPPGTDPLLADAFFKESEHWRNLDKSRWAAESAEGEVRAAVAEGRIATTPVEETKGLWQRLKDKLSRTT